MDEAGKKKVLVIDDESIIRSLVRKTLIHKFEVLEASNGVDAIKVISKNTPDLIILDIMMPEMDGYSFLSYLRNETKNLDIPVIMISANDHMLNKVLGKNLGVVAYIEKPFSTEYLAEMVGKHSTP